MVGEGLDRCGYFWYANELEDSEDENEVEGSEDENEIYGVDDYEEPDYNDYEVFEILLGVSTRDYAGKMVGSFFCSSSAVMAASQSLTCSPAVMAVLEALT
ncbi:hypothetical protein SUGI_1521440 [Cryptomeria japonica]|uniref:Uncharacterized protein n=1 Tax=Cryptomeria japonica TaxID=3369 RepID=A0AAD3RS71_CRYJA|nr:hypothetical protein SUGI_1521440 [Cryptomeria japonica]